jgi:hypothetical protein
LEAAVKRALSLRSLASVLAASAALAGCGGAAVSATKSTHSLTSTSTSESARESLSERPSAENSLTLEEMREYDANEGRCRDDGGSVRNVGTVDAYCAFPTRANDFHLIESAQHTEAGVEEE